MNDKISVIIPVYNVQDYLEECVESVLAQTYKNYEIILVDDGSTDNSVQICDIYAEKNPAVRVIHKENGGAADARNVGVSTCDGDYILFLDADDFYPDSRMLENLLKEIQKETADVVCFNYCRYTDMLRNVELLSTNMDNLSEIVASGCYTSSGCIKFARKELLKKNNLFFIKGMHCEDVEWNANLLRYAEKIVYRGNIVYAYRVRKGSMSQNITLNHIKDICTIISRLASNDISDMPTEKQKAYLDYVAFQYATALINVNICKDKVTREIKQNLKKYSYLLQNDGISSVKLINKCQKILGLCMTSKLLTLYFKLFR